MSVRYLFALGLVLVACLYGLWASSPERFPECRGENIPRHCVE